MTLRKKTLIMIGVTLVGLIVILYAISQIILLGSFAKLEEQNTRRNVDPKLSLSRILQGNPDRNGYYVKT